MSSTEQLAREAEVSRAELAATLAELRERLSPRRLRQDAVRAVQSSAPVQFAADLKRDAASSAVPLAMLAASVLWAASNKKASNDPRPPRGSVSDLVAMGDAAITAAASLGRRATAAASSFRSTSAEALHAIREKRRSVASASEGMGEKSRAAVSQMTRSAGRALRTARSKTAATLDASSRAASRASRRVRSAATVAAKDPVFIAGAGIAAVGIAAAVFGLSRQRREATAASELVEAAEVGIAPEPAPSEAGSGYGRDLNGTSRPAAAELTD